MLQKSAFVIGILLLIGCSGHTVILDNYHRMDIPVTHNPPTEREMAGKRSQVVVFRTANKAELAKKMNTGEAMTGAIESHVTKSAELIDRSVAKKLKEEIALADLRGVGAWDGPNVADYAIMGEITLANSSSKFKEGYTYEDKKGKRYYVNPRCTYNGRVGGNIKIYQLPSLKLVKNIQVHAGQSESEDSPAVHGHCDITDDRVNGLLQRAANNAIDRSRTTLQNIFAAKGYITERRSGKEGDIFKINLGAERGAEKGLAVNIKREEIVLNPLTKKEESETIPLGSGKISDQVESNYAWIVVNDKETANKLMLGDTVVIVYKKGFLESVANIGKR